MPETETISCTQIIGLIQNLTGQKIDFRSPQIQEAAANGRRTHQRLLSPVNLLQQQSLLPGFAIEDPTFPLPPDATFSIKERPLEGQISPHLILTGRIDRHIALAEINFAAEIKPRRQRYDPETEAYQTNWLHLLQATYSCLLCHLEIPDLPIHGLLYYYQEKDYYALEEGAPSTWPLITEIALLCAQQLDQSHPASRKKTGDKIKDLLPETKALLLAAFSYLPLSPPPDPLTYLRENPSCQSL